MRLKCTLVSSFLFVSAVLAGDHPEKQQPPFLDRVEKSINYTTVLPITHWAGAVWLARLQEESVDFAAGTFTVPSAEGAIGSAFDIVVGISGYTCGPETVLGVGITVRVTSTGVSYEAWGHWNPRDVRLAPDTFHISVGDKIRAAVHVRTPTSGVFALINLTTGENWKEEVSGRNQICYQDAEWVIATVKGLALPLPNFHAVTFTEMSAEISGTYRVPNVQTVNIKQSNKDMTETLVYEAYAIIKYKPPV